jgi:U32 family peptidase
MTLRLAHEHGCKVSLAINENSYSLKTRSLALDIAREAVGLGIDAAIVADPDVFLEIRERFPELPVHASGEMGIYNKTGVRQLGLWGIRRVVLPRHLMLEEIEALCDTAREFSLEVEAFVMSERCAFDGAFCFPTHGYLKRHLCNDLDQGRTVLSKGIPVRSELPQMIEDHLRDYDDWRSQEGTSPKWLGGECGLCACKGLSEAGVGFFKIVGRGVAPRSLVERVKVVRSTVDYGGPEYLDFCKGLIDSPATCESGYRCYYRG